MSYKKFINQFRKKFPLDRIQKLFYGTLIVFGIILGLFVSNIIITFTRLTDIKPLETYSKYSVPTKIFDINGQLITEFFYQKREIVSYKDMPEYLIKALIATEDSRFYKHRGLNLVAMFKGVVLNVLTGRKPRGGSTITQQLAKGLFTEGERTILRKFVELWYAFQIEKKYSKEEILELYFNQFYFGHGCYGIESAAKFYFDKQAKDLTLSESSLLVGFVQAPSRYSPIFHPDLAQWRHQMVLTRMVAVDYISQQQADEAFESLWENYATSFKNKGISASRNQSNPAPYFTEYIRKILLNKYGEEILYTGGLQIYTTLDLKKQKYAREELKKAIIKEQKHYDKDYRKNSQLFRRQNEDIVDMVSLIMGIDKISIGQHKIKKRIEEMTRNYNDFIYLTSFMFGVDPVNKKIKKKYLLSGMVSQKKDQIEGALISINPKNGHIEAMVGGREFTYANQFNRAILAQRQMGSAFKPIYYAIGIENRIFTPATTYEDAPMVFENIGGALWSPRNYSGTYMGTLRIHRALQHSVNVVATQVWHDEIKKIGYTSMMKTMAKMFGLSEEEMKKRVGPQMAFSLGVAIFSPYEVSRAFATIANGGKYVEPIAITRVLDRYGRNLDDEKAFKAEKKFLDEDSQQVLMPGTAFIMQNMLRTVLFNGTGSIGVSEAGFYGPAGGKTGTTANWKDAWFCGFTRNLSTVVWMGFDDPNKSLGRHRAASALAAPIWCKYMKKVMKDDFPPGFHNPGGVYQTSVCYDTGLSPTPYCPHVVSEYFLTGTGPSKKCNLHTTDTPDIPEAMEITSITDLNINLDDENDGIISDDDTIPDSSELDDVNLDLDLDADF